MLNEVSAVEFSDVQHTYPYFKLCKVGRIDHQKRIWQVGADAG